MRCLMIALIFALSSCSVMRTGFTAVTGVSVPTEWTIPSGVQFVRELRQPVSELVEDLAPLLPEDLREDALLTVGKLRNGIREAEVILVDAWNGYVHTKSSGALIPAFSSYQNALKGFLDWVSQVAGTEFQEQLAPYRRLIEGLGSLAGIALARVDFAGATELIPEDSLSKDFDFVEHWALPLSVRLNGGGSQ